MNKKLLNFLLKPHTEKKPKIIKPNYSKSSINIAIKNIKLIPSNPIIINHKKKHNYKIPQKKTAIIPILKKKRTELYREN